MGDITDSIIQGYTFDNGLYEYGGTKRCRYCGEGGLHWDLTNERRYRLANSSGVWHTCRAYPRGSDYDMSGGEGFG